MSAYPVPVTFLTGGPFFHEPHQGVVPLGLGGRCDGMIGVMRCPLRLTATKGYSNTFDTETHKS